MSDSVRRPRTRKRDGHRLPLRATDHDCRDELERWKRFAKATIASHQQKPSPPLWMCAWRDPVGSRDTMPAKQLKLLRLPVERGTEDFFSPAGIHPER